MQYEDGRAVSGEVVQNQGDQIRSTRRSSICGTGRAYAVPGVTTTGRGDRG